MPLNGPSYKDPSSLFQVFSLRLEKNPFVLLEGLGKRNHFEICESIVFLHQMGPQEKLFHQNLTYWSFIEARLPWGKGSTQLQPPVTVLSNLQERKH